MRGSTLVQVMVCCLQPASPGQLQWRHNGRNGVSNNRRFDCLLDRLFRRRSNVEKSFHLMTLSSPWKFWLRSRGGYFEWQVGNVRLWCHSGCLLSVLIYYYHSVNRTSCGDHPGSNIWNIKPLLWFPRHTVCWQTVCWQLFSPIPGSVFPAYVTKYFYWYRKYQNR